jgi:hypothetical protein
MFMQNNRRKSERVNVSLEVEIESASGRREVRISDLSEGGCFVDSISIVNMREPISIRARISPNEWIELKGEIVSVFPGIGFGVRFSQLSEKEQDQLRKLIVAHGGTVSPQPEKLAEKEIQNADQPPAKESDLPAAQKKSFNEFEEFLQDVMGDTSEVK